MTVFDYVIGWAIGVTMFVAMAKFLTDRWPWEFGELRKKKELNPQPRCPVCACTRDYQRPLYPCTHPGCPEVKP